MFIARGCGTYCGVCGGIYPGEPDRGDIKGDAGTKLSGEEALDPIKVKGEIGLRRGDIRVPILAISPLGITGAGGSNNNFSLRYSS